MQAESLDILEESLAIPSPAGTLAAVLAYPFVSQPCGAVLVAGPHPLMGGGLQNNVVRAVSRGMAEHGFVSLRFAYAGAVTSPETMQAFWQTGSAPTDLERVEDARLALEHLRSICQKPLVLIGYSFGAFVVGTLIDKSQPSHVVLIGPTLCQHNFDLVQRSNVPKLIITADNDFATPLEHTRAWVERAQSPKKLVVIETAEHFYRGLEDRLVSEIIPWL